MTTNQGEQLQVSLGMGSPGHVDIALKIPASVHSCQVTAFLQPRRTSPNDCTRITVEACPNTLVGVGIHRCEIWQS